MKKHIFLLFLSFFMITSDIQCNAPIDITTIDLFAFDENGNTEFHKAAQSGDNKTMQLLLAKQNEPEGWLDSIYYYLWGNTAYPINLQNDNGDTPLHLAVKNSHPEIVDTILINGSSKIDQKITNHQGYTPLFLAIDKGDDRTVTMFITHDSTYDTEKLQGKNVIHHALKYPKLIALFALNKKLLNEKDNDGNTPLLLAIVTKNNHAARMLLDHGANASIPSQRGLPALHESIYTGDFTITHAILDTGISIDSTDELGKTAFRHAVDLNEQKTITLLLQRKANSNKADQLGNTPIHSAAIQGNLEMVRFLENNGANSSAKNNQHETIAHIAARNDHVALMHYILKKHKTLSTMINSDGNCPMHIAVYNGKKSIAQLLIAHGLPINVRNHKGDTPLHIATETENVECLDLFLKHNPDWLYNNKGWSPMHTAAAHGFVKGIQKLKEHGAPITDLTKEQNSALHLAYSNSHFNCTELLITPAIINSQNNDGLTPLHILATKNVDNRYVLNSQIDLLLSYMYDINIQDKKGYSALAHAVHSGNLDVIKKLHQNGASLFTHTKTGDTLMHLAAQSGNAGIIHYLKNKGLNLRNTNYNNETPLMHAAFCGKTNLLEILLTENDFLDGTIHKAERMAQNKGYYDTARILEQKIRQRKMDCQDLKTLQETIENLKNTNFKNSLILAQKTAHNYKQYAYNYIPMPCTTTRLSCMTTDEMYQLSPAQRADLMQQLSNCQYDELLHQTQLNYSLESITHIEQERHNQYIKHDQEKKELLNICQHIITTQNTLTNTIKTNKNLDMQLKNTHQQKPVINYAPYCPSQCAQEPCMNLEQLLNFESKKRSLYNEKLLKCQSHESQEKTRLEQQKLALTGQQKPPNNQNNQQNLSECCICLKEKIDAKPIPCTNCNKGSSHICSACLAKITAQNGRCPMCNLNTLQPQPKMNQPHMPPQSGATMPHPSQRHF